MLKIKRAPDMMARLGQKSRLTAVVKKDVQSEAEKDISEQHDGSILKLTNTALRSSLAKRTPRGTSIEEVSDMSTVKLAAYAGMGYAMESVRSSLAKAIPETLEAGVYSRADSLEHAVTIPIKEISHIVRLPHDSHGIFVKLNPAVFPEALQKIATPEVHKMLDARVVLIHVSFASRIRHAFGEDKCGRVERYEAKYGSHYHSRAVITCLRDDPKLQEFMQASGLKWVNIGDKKPETGVELMNDELAMALAKEPEGTDGVKSFDPEEWEKKDGFGCGKDAKEWKSALRMEHYIFSSGSYYKPSTPTGEIIFEKSGEVGYLRDCRDFDNVDGSHFFKAVDFYQAADILAPRFYRFLDQVEEEDNAAKDEMYRKKVKAWIESGQGPTPSRLAAMDEAERFNLAMAALCVDAQLSVNKRGQGLLLDWRNSVPMMTGDELFAERVAWSANYFLLSFLILMIAAYYVSLGGSEIDFGGIFMTMALAHVLTPILEEINKYLGMMEWLKSFIRSPHDVVLGMVQDQVDELKEQAKDLQGMAEEGLANLTAEGGIVDQAKEHVKESADSAMVVAIGTGIIARTSGKYRDWRATKEREKVISSFRADPKDTSTRSNLFKEASESVSLNDFFFEEEHAPLEQRDVELEIDEEKSFVLPGSSTAESSGLKRVTVNFATIESDEEIVSAVKTV